MNELRRRAGEVPGGLPGRAFPAPSGDLWRLLDALCRRWRRAGRRPRRRGGRPGRGTPTTITPAASLRANSRSTTPTATAFALIDYQYQHRLLAPFRDWASQPDKAAYLASRRAYQYWAVKPAEGVTVLLRYGDKDKHPALLERTAEAGRGKVVLFTTPMDGRQDAAQHPANNFNANWFYFAFVNEAVKYLAGEAEDATLNYPAGPPVTIPLPPDARSSDLHDRRAGPDRGRHANPAGRVGGGIAAHAAATAGPVRRRQRRPQMADAVQPQRPGGEVAATAAAGRRHHRRLVRPGFGRASRPDAAAQGRAGRPVPPAGRAVPVADDPAACWRSRWRTCWPTNSTAGRRTLRIRHASNGAPAITSRRVLCFLREAKS